MVPRFFLNLCIPDLDKIRSVTGQNASMHTQYISSVLLLVDGMSVFMIGVTLQKTFHVIMEY